MNAKSYARVVLPAGISYDLSIANNYLRRAEALNEDPKAERYVVEFILSQYYIGASKTRSWNASSGPPNTVPPAIRPSYDNGSICVSYANSGGTLLRGQHLQLAGPTNSGFAQVTIYLK